MLKRFVGTILIAVAVLVAATACGETAETIAPTPVVQEIVESALLPTVNAKGATAVVTPRAITPTAGITAEASEATRTAAIDAQRAKGWPTPEGNSREATNTPAPTPIDKSNWTIIEPGKCDDGSTMQVGEIDELRKTLFAFILFSWARDEAELVKIADLVIHGVPFGSIEMEPSRHRGSFNRFYQDVRILEVLSGETSSDTVRVLQIAFDYATSPENLEKYEITLGTGDDYGYPGPLGQCPQILFLNTSSGDVFSSVGITQGVFTLGPDSRVVYAPEFESFVGLDVAQVKSRVEMLGQR
ncbi:MAG: hypothetical protein IH872_01320 [Chloroflexi bacterium]|nr:hypothetical protein [Chloroflexota bacterium]